MRIFNRISASIQARYIRPWILNHFDKTASGKALAGYKNKYEGQRCFLIGNGPSLRAEDLMRLHEAGEITFGFNRIYNIFDQTPWRPTFYISQDEKMLGGCADMVSNLALGQKFIPVQLRWWHNIRISHVTEFNIIGQDSEDPQHFCFSDDIAKGIYNSSTCMYTAAQIAAYMGFSEIYLIGVDHNFRISQNNAGQIVVDNSVKDYFSDKYNQDKENLYIPSTEKSTLTYVAMKNHCEKRGIRVFNATRGGKLEVFQRVEFDKLFE
jgi:hypothetical protein